MSDTEPLGDNVVPEVPAATATPPQPSRPAPIPPAAPAPAARLRQDRPRRSLWPLLGLIGFLLLAGGEAYLWRLDKTRPDDSGQIAALQAQVTALQQRPAPAPVPAAPAPAAPVAAAPDAALAQKTADTAAQVSALQTQFAADHASLATLQANAIDLGKLTADIGAVETEATADHAALLTLQASFGDLNKLTSRVAALGSVDGARMALDAGQPLGPIPNAPPALAMFAATPPPTEAGLRLSFPAAARAAAAASTGAKRGYWANVVARLENLVTISNGAHVIVGAPAAGILAEAGARLDAGDLAGAVGILNTLDQASQQAMGDWLTQARNLVAARAALTAMAAQPAAGSPMADSP